MNNKSTFNRLKRIMNDLMAVRITEFKPIKSLKIKQCNYHDWKIIHEDSSKWKEYADGEAWGGIDTHCIFKHTLVIPASFQDKHIVCQIQTGAEDIWNYDNPQFIAYINGKVVCGLDINHVEFDICEKAQAGDTYELALYAYVNSKYKDVLMHIGIGVKDIQVEQLYYDLKVAIDLVGTLEAEDVITVETLLILNQTIQLLDLRKVGSEEFYYSIGKALDYFEKQFYNAYCKDSNIIEHCVGHTHIDVAWLWPIEQTREKVIRSFSSVLYLMNKYPKYKFMSSQPQLYEFIKNDCPEIYEKIKERVKEGRWEVEGSMWLEADCNIISGESLIRQILYGKRFFHDEFGKDNKVLWLPDVFGYSAALPQIMKKSGIDYFMTTKIAWNDMNMMPNDTMLWQGIDGTEILTHFITTTDYKKNKRIEEEYRTTYNGLLNVSQVKGCWQRYQNKTLSNNILQCFGYGDGGGGPTQEMLEYSNRLELGLPTVPQVKQSFVLEFFEELEKNVSKNKKLPKWCGELYLEYHRGTYTSMAKNKRYNRLSEIKTIDAEMFSTLTYLQDATYIYPKDKLDYCWKTIMLNQFHDILSGTSIKKIYDNSSIQYEKVLTTVSNLIEENMKALVSRIDIEYNALIVFNPLSFMQSDLVVISKDDLPKKIVNKDLIVLDETYSLLYQKGYDGNWIFYVHNIPSKGYKSFTLLDKKSKETPHLLPFKFEQIKINKWTLETPFYSIKINDNGEFVSIYDKDIEREMIKEGQRGNVLQIFEDRPHDFEAWNIELYYQEKMWEITDLEEIDIVENGPLRSCIKIKRCFLDSTIEQLIFFYNHSKRIDFKTFVKWNEEHLLLKVTFPVNVLANKAIYDIQYGNIERNTHWNTPWDIAKFEVCGHKWADLSEYGYGISLINDCKYGYDIKDSIIRLSLIKSPTYPNPESDKGEHEFTYSIYPHKGDFRTGKVIQTALAMNNSLYAVFKKKSVSTEVLPREKSFVTISKENIFLETIKRAEDSSAIIMRFYEAYGLRSHTNIKFSIEKIKSVKICDLMENVEKKLPYIKNEVIIEFKPYEIITLLFEIE